MRPESIREEKNARKRSALFGASLFALKMLAGCLAPGIILFFWSVGREEWPQWLFPLCLATVVILLLPVLCLPVALWRRFREIEKGEWYEARKY